MHIVSELLTIFISLQSHKKENKQEACPLPSLTINLSSLPLTSVFVFVTSLPALCVPVLPVPFCVVLTQGTGFIFCPVVV